MCVTLACDREVSGPRQQRRRRRRNIGNVSVEMIDDSKKPRIRRPLRVNPTIILPQKHARIGRVGETQKEFHSAAVLIGRDRVSFELAVRRDEAMFARECLGYEKEGNHGESTHRPNETKLSDRR